MHTTTNYTAYIRGVVAKPAQRIALGLVDAGGQTTWGDSSGEAEGVCAYLFHPPPDLHPVALEVVVLDPVQAEFVVTRPPTTLDASAVAASVQDTNFGPTPRATLRAIRSPAGAAVTNAPSTAGTNGLTR